MHSKVTVIGGGLGSLSGAIYLARMGFDVQLFEQNHRLGGKVNELVLDSYRFDTGPTLLTMGFVIDELFRYAGFDRSEFLEFMPVDPICRYFFSDGSIMDASADMDKMMAAVESLSPGEGDAYGRFLEYCKQIYDLTAEVFLFTPIHEIKKVLGKGDLSTLLNLRKMDPFHTMHQGICKFFSDPRLIQLFDRYATYTGSDPYKAPATLNIISYVEHGLGGYYIKGGIYRLVEALENVAEKLGIEINTSAKVEKILWESGKVKGIQVNNEAVIADYVLCGADVVIAYNSLIHGLERRRQKMNRLEPSLSGMVFLWGVKNIHPELAQHNIIFSEDYEREFQQIFGELKPPDDPTVYISISSKTDPEHAPPDSENWFVLLNMPYLDGEAHVKDWNSEIERMRESVFTKLRRIGIHISKHIETERVYTPEDLLSLYASNRGSIYGISSNSKTTAFKRHANRSRDIEGLYFAGGSVHPGGGIPLTILSGKMAAELIAEHAERHGIAKADAYSQ
ncbi:phytoene desaturase family protein [Candidatus Poribacteria bacterium]